MRYDFMDRFYRSIWLSKNLIFFSKNEFLVKQTQSCDARAKEREKERKKERKKETKERKKRVCSRLVSFVEESAYERAQM